MTDTPIKAPPTAGQTELAKESVAAPQVEQSASGSNASLLARDFSRPHTIPPEDYEAATGRSHPEDVAEYERRETAARVGDGDDSHPSPSAPPK